MSDGIRAPCVRCGLVLHTGEGKIIVGLTCDQLAELIESTTNARTRAQLLCALTLLDPDRAEALDV